MKKLYLFRHQAEVAINNDYVISSCDVEECDCGNCAQADRILATAMGEVQCFRDRISGEVLAAWWNDDEPYECEVTLRFGDVYIVEVSCGDLPECKISISFIGAKPEDEDDMLEIIKMF